MAKEKFNLFCSDPFGQKDEATDICNNKLVPLLKKIGINKEDIEKVVGVVKQIALAAYSSGAENESFNRSEGDI